MTAPPGAPSPALRLLAQFVRFAMVGAMGTVLQYLVLWVGVEGWGMRAAAASGLGYAMGAVVNYLMNYFVTFGGGGSHWRAARRYFTLLAVGWCLNLAVMWTLVDGAGWRYWTAQLLSTGLGLLWNFAGSRWWAFRTDR